MRARILTGALLVLLAGAVTLGRRMGRAQVSDAEPVAWGASDPNWSPDGKWLAFSLFGSIWRVPAEGGEAQQVTSSPGYHGHPAWSPKGDQIVFVRSAKPPYHRTLNVSGKLVLVDVESGREREIPLRNPTAGTPAWSPDGAFIACGLRLPDGAFLHIISASDGAARQIQFASSVHNLLPLIAEGATERAIKYWLDAAWSPRFDEIFFGGVREDLPQIWSMPAVPKRILVEMPLTKYRREDTADFRGVAALPDGSGAIYSGVVVNGKGDYELYRVSREGGPPVDLTNTSRDEFSPAISRDGKRVAFVSNELGNIDLFTMPASGGKQRHVQITNLRFRRPSAMVHVRVLDENGQPTPARLYVRASDGKSYGPAGSPSYYFPLDPRGNPEGFFIGSGDDTFPVPAGALRLVARKGIEYRIEERSLDAAADQTTEVTLALERWTNWMERGWYTGENHFHANLYGSYYQRATQSLGWLMAEDLNVANMLVSNSVGGFVHDKEFFEGHPNSLSNGRYILYWGEEYRNRNAYGHLCLLNLKRLVEPGFTGFPGTQAPYDFPLNTMAALATHRQGGVVDYTHPMYESANDFFENGNAKELPVAAALSGVDIIDIQPWGQKAVELWYSMLNCGFKIAPGAGADTFTNYRGITRLPGASREYVEVGPALDWNHWLERLREGRDFVTNGPLLTFTVNGKPMGSVIRVPEGSTYKALLNAEITADIPLTLVELIRNGEVIESRRMEPGACSFRMQKEVPVDRSCWFAVRVTGEPGRGGAGLSLAHSGAIYVNVGNRPALVREDLELMIRMIDRLWAYLEEQNRLGPGENRARAQNMFAEARRHYVEKVAQLGEAR